MNEKIYNPQNITAYLLGSLPDSQTEVFDELSFTDDQFADQLRAAEKDLVDAYINGELSETNLQQFNSFYLASPLRQEKVAFAKAFQSFAGQELAGEAIHSAPKKRFWADFLTLPRLSLQWGFALATLVLMFLGGWLILENSRLRSEVGQTQSSRDELLKRQTELAEREKQLQAEISDQRTVNSETEKVLAEIRAEREKLEQELRKERTQREQIIAERQKTNDRKRDSQISSPGQINIASFILTPQLRSNNQLPRLTVSSKISLVETQLELEADDYSAYRVALVNQSTGQTLWRSGRIKSKTQGTNRVLNLSFPAHLLKSQVYSLQVSGFPAQGAAEIISDYTFRVVR